MWATVHAAAAPDHASRGPDPDGGTDIIAREFAALLIQGLGGKIEVIEPGRRLRLGYLVVPLALASAFAWAKRLTDRHSLGLEQEALAGLIESGAYERHVRRVRHRNGERRAALLAALSATLGDAETVVGADAGLHVVVWLNRVLRTQEEASIARAHAAGLGVYPVTPLYAPDPAAARPGAAGLVMGYASLDERTIARGVRMLSEVLEAFAAEDGAGRG